MSACTAIGLLLVLAMIRCLRLDFLGQEPGPGPRPFRAAAVQINPRIYLKDCNTRRLADRVAEAAGQGARLIVTPEMATTGLLFRDREDVAPFVEPIPGPTTDLFAAIAARHGCYIAIGLPEVDPETDLYYNAMALVGPEGLVGRYRKTHLWETDAHWAAWGNLGVPVFETGLGRVALLICHDANYVETFRLAMLGGADVVCFATNSSGQTIGHLQARAVQNRLYIVSSNRSNDEIDARNGAPFAKQGCSAVWSPAGEKLVEAGRDTEETVVATIAPDRRGPSPDPEAGRRPEAYRDLIRHIAPWNLLASERSRRVRALALQYEPVAGDVSKNLETVEGMLAEALGAGPDRPSGEATLVVLPELSFTGPLDPAGARATAERLDGRLVRYVSRLAQRHRASIAFGMVEDAPEGLANAAVLVGPRGELVGRARKVHLTDDDRGWARPGDRFAVFKTAELGRVGLLVGADAYYPESGTILGVERADVVAVPSSWSGEVADDGAIRIDPAVHPHADRGGMVLWDDLAWTNFYYVVAANYVGTGRGYLGRSGIYSPDPIYGIASPALARTAGPEVVAGGFRTLHNGIKRHWTDQNRFVGSRRSDDLYYPIVRCRPRPTLAEGRGRPDVGRTDAEDHEAPGANGRRSDHRRGPNGHEDAGRGRGPAARCGPAGDGPPAP